MKNKIAVLGMLAIMLALGLVLGGCISLESLGFGTFENVETETSQEILKAALDLVLSRENGIIASLFDTALAQQFPGAKVTTNGPATQTLVDYQDKRYRLELTSEDRDINYYILSIKKCYEIRAKETAAQ
jgi:hypothetical protein